MYLETCKNWNATKFRSINNIGFKGIQISIRVVSRCVTTTKAKIYD